MRAWLLLFLCACEPAATSSFGGPPLVSLRGQVSVPKGRNAPEPARLAIVWTSERSRTSFDGTVELRSPWPAHFALPLFALPSRSSDGVVVAYADGNRNGALDVSDDAADTSDVVLGASALPAADGGFAGFVLRYVDTAPPSGSGLQQGFNLVHDDAGVVAFSTELELSLTGSPLFDALRRQTPGPSVRTPPPMRVTGSVGRTSLRGAAYLDVLDAAGPVPNATLRINGMSVPYSPATGRFETLDAGLTDTTLVRAEAPGYAPYEFPVAVPGRVRILSPLPGAVVRRGEPLLAQWTAVPGVTAYRVSVREVGFEVSTPDTMLTIPANTFVVGMQSLTVSTAAANVTDSAGSSVYPYSNESFALRVVE